MENEKRIFDKLDKIDDRLNNIDTTLAAQHEVLKDHVRRSTNLEDRIIPIERHVVVINAAAKFLGLLIAGGLLTEIISLFVKH